MIFKIIKRFLTIIGAIVSILLILYFTNYYNNDDIIDLGSGYNYYTEQMSILSDYIDIPPYIGYYNFDDRFIIAIQNPCGKNSDVMYNNYTCNLDLNLAYYWIIDKYENRYYGPLTDQRYKFLTDSLNINISFKPSCRITSAKP